MLAQNYFRAGGIGYSFGQEPSEYQCEQQGMQYDPATDKCIPPPGAPPQPAPPPGGTGPAPAPGASTASAMPGGKTLLYVAGGLLAVGLIYEAVKHRKK